MGMSCCSCARKGLEMSLYIDDTNNNPNTNDVPIVNKDIKQKENINNINNISDNSSENNNNQIQKSFKSNNEIIKKEDNINTNQSKRVRFYDSIEKNIYDEEEEGIIDS